MGGYECEQPFPKGTLERFDVALAEANEEIAHGAGAGKPFDAEQDVKGFVGAKPVGMGEAAERVHLRYGSQVAAPGFTLGITPFGIGLATCWTLI